MSYTPDAVEHKIQHPDYNTETEAAMREAEAIVLGKVSAKSYASARELFTELDADEKAEEKGGILGGKPS